MKHASVARQVDDQDRVCRCRRFRPQTRWRRRPVPRLIGFDYVHRETHADDAGDSRHRQRACHRLMQQWLRHRMTNETSYQRSTTRNLRNRFQNDSIAFRPVAGRKGLFVKSPAALRRVA